MKAISQIVNGFYTSYWRAYSGSPVNGPSNTTSLAIRYDVVPGPIVHGNMHDPNSWYYTVTYVRAFKGEIASRSYSYPQGEGWQRGYFGGGSSSPVAPSWESRSFVYNLALSRLNDQARGNLDLSIALAEAGTTVRMIKALKNVTSFASAFRGAFNSTKRGKPRRAFDPGKGQGWNDPNSGWSGSLGKKSRKRRPPEKGFNASRFGSTKDLANGWLQWQYGWKPLMSDVFNIADEAIRITLNNIQSVSGSATKPIVVNTKTTTNVMSFAAPILRSGTGKESCRIKVAFSVPSFDLARWTSLNPVSIGWELIPYSFVIDWFVDVGSYLRNLETALLYNTAFLSGYVSELYVYEGTESVDYNALKVVGVAPNQTYYYYRGVQAKIRKVQFYRTKLTSWPLPRKPTFNVGLGSQRLFSAAALLRQLLK